MIALTLLLCFAHCTRVNSLQVWNIDEDESFSSVLSGADAGASSSNDVRDRIVGTRSNTPAGDAGNVKKSSNDGSVFKLRLSGQI